ncbi:hypothetical protein LguiB_034143 [Lonicera macranthoides]
MLSREIADLPTPKQPAFTERQSNSVKEEIQENCSVNSATFTGKPSCSYLHRSMFRMSDKENGSSA